MDQAGYLNGRYYVTYVGDVEEMIRQGRLDEARTLLLTLLDTIEYEARLKGQGVAPWYYERLTIIARKQKDGQGERAVLERFARQRHAPGVAATRLMAYLEHLRAQS